MACNDCVQGDTQNGATGTQGDIGAFASNLLGDSESHLPLEGEEHKIMTKLAVFRYR